jgi:hypothetical protein
MYIATRNFKHSGKPCKAGNEYEGKDIEFLLKEKLIVEKKKEVKREIKEVKEEVKKPKKSK